MSQVTKYLGRNEIIDAKDPTTQAVIQNVIELVETLTKTTFLWRKSEWENLKTEVSRTLNEILNREKAVRKFQLEILNDAVVPYIKKMTTRLSLDSKRFSQVEILLHHLRGETYSVDVHPALVLQNIERCASSILESSGGWTSNRSELVDGLNAALRKQWAPIISDYRSPLLDLGGKLAATGVIQIIGAHFLILWPLYFSLMKGLKLVNEVQATNHVSPKNVVEIVKSLLILLFVYKLSVVLALFSQLGYLCVVVGVGGIICASSPNLLKASIPLLTPLLQNVDQIYLLMDGMDNQFQSILPAAPLLRNNNAVHQSAPLNSASSISRHDHGDRVELRAHPQVEELPEPTPVDVKGTNEEDEPKDDDGRNLRDSDINNDSVTNGLRKRK